MFQNKVVAITASATGIGLATALAFLLQGATVYISSRNQKNVDQALALLKQKSPKVFGSVCHVGKKQDRTKWLQQIESREGGLDVLVCNAAVSTAFGNCVDATQQQIMKMWQINYTSTYSIIKQSLDLLKKRKGSNIIIISSESAYSPVLAKTISHYAATKAALLFLGKTLAIQLSPMRVNMVAPGLIRTKFSKDLWKNEQETKKSLGIDRIGQGEDVAGTVVFLASEKASYITGQTVIVAGKVIPRL